MPGRRLAPLLASVLLAAGLWAAPAPALAGGTAPEHVDPGELLLVRVAPGANRAAVHAAAGAAVVNRLEAIGVDVVRPGAGSATRYAGDPRVLWAEPNAEVRAAETPDDRWFRDQWNLHNTGQSGGTPDADVDAPEGWENVALGSGTWQRRSGSVAVGIIDSGIDLTHPDLSGQVVVCAQATSGTGQVTPGTCSDDNGHGTHVAGTVAAKGNDGTGVVGVAPTVGLAVCKALNAVGSGDLDDVAACILHLADHSSTHRVRALNMSITTCGESPTMKSAIDYAASRGVLSVAAAGNTTPLCPNDPNAPRYPAAYSNVVSVAATDRDDGHPSFSVANSSVEVSAPGAEILSTYLAGTWAEKGGTSMATPHVAAAAALVHERTGLTGSRLRSLLRSAVDDLGPAGRDDAFGHGRLNLRKALHLGGYVGDGFGGLHPFRSGDGAPLPPVVRGPYWPGWDIVRGVAQAPGGGYVVDGWGGIHPFWTGGIKPAAASGGPYWEHWDIVRGAAVRRAGGGYMVDGWGGVHRFATGGVMPPVPSGGPYWKHWDIVRGVALHPGGGGYLVDGFGGLHRFATGGVMPPVPSGGPYWKDWDIVRGVILLADGTGGYVVDGWGALHAFRTGSNPLPPPAVPSAGWPGWDIARDVG